MPGAFERGLALAAVRALGDRAPAWLRTRGDAIARHAASLAADPSLRASEAAALGAVPPDGMERVHASWWQPVVAARGPARVWLERRAAAHLVAMPPPSGAGLDALDGRSETDLLDLLERLGRRRVAVAFSDAPRPALAQLCARLGEPAASALLDEVESLIAVPHDEVRSAQRALFKLAVDAPDARSLFLSAGARWLAPALAARGADLVHRVAQRLPLAVGTLLRTESTAPSTPPDHTTVEQTALGYLRPTA